jgi:protein-tyrosine kinase
MSRVDEALSKARGGQTNGPSEKALGGRQMPVDAGVELWPTERTDASRIQSSSDRRAVPSTMVDDSDQDSVEEPRRRTIEQNASADEKLVLTPGADQQSIEQYRRLAARLHLAQVENGIKVVMVASALPGEGKTLTAANLALTLSESYRRQVLLIDGDLRRPWIHELLRLPNVSGLNDRLKSPGRKVPLIRWSECLTVITAGRPDADPMSVLSSDQMSKIVAEAAKKFDWVVIDTPPIGLLSDAHLLASLAETVLLVVEANRTPHADIQRAVQAIGRERIFGIVLNRARAQKQLPYYSAYAVGSRQDFVKP